MGAGDRPIGDLAPARRYYAGRGLAERVRAALDAEAPGGALGIEALAPLDQNHIGGAGTTRRLARAARLAPGSRVLDAGSALGGSARHLAREFGCRVVGIDLSLGFCGVAMLLGTHLAPGPLPRFVCGSALELPFAGGVFDAVWLQHATMNIAAKDRLLGEAARVLRRGGRLVLHEVVSGPRRPVHLPVPWATDDALDQVAPEPELRRACAAAGLGAVTWSDTSSEALAWFRLQAGARPSSVANGIDLIFPEVGPERRRNVVRNLLERRLRVVEAVLRKEAP